MAPKQLKLTELFAVRDTLTKRGKRKLAESSLSPEEGSSSDPKRRPSADGVSGSRAVQIPLPDSAEQTVVGPAVQNECIKENVGHESFPLLSTLKNLSWTSLLRQEFKKDYVKGICRFLEDRAKKGVTIFPPRHLVFNAFNLTSFNKIRVVIIGQDPYHNLRQAHGLCFSVPNGEPLPPSLKNIFKEIASEYPQFKMPEHGTLTRWAEQGVFLLNATLTVEAHKANSHSHIGWQQFTDAVIKLVSDKSAQGTVFLLWGGFAHKKEALINTRKHRVIKAAHPSPLSAHKFFGCKCFSKTNAALVELGREPIVWTDI